MEVHSETLTVEPIEEISNIVYSPGDVGEAAAADVGEAAAADIGDAREAEASSTARG